MQPKDSSSALPAFFVPPFAGRVGWCLPFPGRQRTPSRFAPSAVLAARDRCGVVLVILALAYVLLLRPLSAGMDRDHSQRVALQMAVLIGPLLFGTYLAPPTFSAAALERRAGLSGGMDFGAVGRTLRTLDPPRDHRFRRGRLLPRTHPGSQRQRGELYRPIFPGSNGEFRFCRVLIPAARRTPRPFTCTSSGRPGIPGNAVDHGGGRDLFPKG